MDKLEYWLLNSMSSELKWARNFNRFMFGTIVTGILWCPFVVATVINIINLETGSFDLYRLPGSLETGFQWSCVVTLFEHLCRQSLTHDIFLILIRFMWASVAKALHDCRRSGDVIITLSPDHYDQCGMNFFGPLSHPSFSQKLDWFEGWILADCQHMHACNKWQFKSI